MKRIILSLVAVLLMSSSVFSEGKPLLVSDTVINYGTINKGDDGLRELVIKNEGDAPLIISGVGSSCGCTVPSWPKEPILPGTQSVIKVVYSTSRVGKISKSITVRSNCSKKPIKVVKLAGEVLNTASK